jgi:antitoxin component YwqK of YwqJK toxin-antitoxin module
MSSMKKILFPVILFLFCTSFFSCKNKFDGKNGTYTAYFDGTKHIEQTIEYKDGLKNGWTREYYPNSKVRFEAKFVNDTMTDTVSSYHENGKLYHVQIYKDGMKEGCWKKYSKEGVLYQENNYKNDMLEGPSNKFTYITGRPLEKTFYKYGMKEGRQEIFHNNGKQKSVSYFSGNQVCLGLEEWYESGKKVNNNFKISIQEQNKVLFENKLRFIVTLENPQEDDKVYEISDSDTGRTITPFNKLIHEGNQHIFDYPVYKGSYVLRKIRIAAFRKTWMGNVMIRTAVINVSGGNY